MGMDFPLTIRSYTSTMDLSTPLFVDTNIVYQIDEMRFPGIQDSSHCDEPALIFESDISSNSKIIFTEFPATPIAWDDENLDLYNLIESLDTENTMLPSADNLSILDLPDIQLDLTKEEMSVTSVVELPSREKVASQFDCVPGKLTCSFSFNNYKIFEETMPCDAIEPSTCNDYQDTPSCRFPNSRSCPSRKRRMSSSHEQDVLHSIQTDNFVSTKRMKFDLHQLCLNTYCIENCFDSVIDDNSLHLSLYSDFEHTSMFNFCGITTKGLTDRPC